MKYSPEIVQEICKHIRAGNSFEDSALLSGIAESTFYEWKKKSEFSEAIKKAEAESKAFDILTIKRAAQGVKGTRTFYKIIKDKKTGEEKQVIDRTEEYWLEKPNWVAAAWRLERRYRDEYALKTEQVIKGLDSIADLMMEAKRIKEKQQKIKNERRKKHTTNSGTNGDIS